MCLGRVVCEQANLMQLVVGFSIKFIAIIFLFFGTALLRANDI